jgi:hypothetical protein
MFSNAWKCHEDESGIDYSLQFTDVPWKFKKALFEALKDWRRIAVGWKSDTGNQIYIFKKSFRSEVEWEKWANSFPIQIKEMKYRAGKEKVIIHGKTSK